MTHQTIRDTERLTKLSEGKCDLDDVEALIERIVDVCAMTLTGRATPKKNSEGVAAPVRRAEKLRS
jgi:hypothetical protein